MKTIDELRNQFINAWVTDMEVMADWYVEQMGKTLQHIERERVEAKVEELQRAINVYRRGNYYDEGIRDRLNQLKKGVE